MSILKRLSHIDNKYEGNV